MSSQTTSTISAEKFQGVIPPVVLPLQETQETDYQSLNRQIDFLLAGGVDGLWVNGTTGDFFALSDVERAEVVRAVVSQAAGRVPVIAQVGDTSTRRVITHAFRALEAGADAISVVLPYYLSYTQVELKQHYRIISKEIRAPIFLYQIPQMCKVALTLPSIIELAREGVLIGIKDSAGDVNFYHRLLREVAETKVSLRCFYGASSLIDVGLYTGGHGVMCAIANLVPHLCKRAYQQAAAANWGAVKETNAQILALIDALSLPERTTWAPLVAVYKWILRELGVIATDVVFEPLQPLSQQEQDLIRKRALPMARKLCADLLAATGG